MLPRSTFRIKNQILDRDQTLTNIYNKLQFLRTIWKNILFNKYDIAGNDEADCNSIMINSLLVSLELITYFN